MIKSKRLAAVLALLAALIMLFSVLFIAIEAGHDCCGDDCAICAQMRACEDLLRNLLPAAALLLSACCFRAPVDAFAGSECRFFYPLTLIALKVKLSD